MKKHIKKPGKSSNPQNKISSSALVMHRLKGEHEFVAKSNSKGSWALPFDWGVRVCRICGIEDEVQLFGHANIMTTMSGGLSSLSLSSLDQDWMAVDMNKDDLAHPDQYIMSPDVAKHYMRLFDDE